MNSTSKGRDRKTKQKIHAKAGDYIHKNFGLYDIWKQMKYVIRRSAHWRRIVSV